MLQCKDIPDQEFLDAVELAGTLRGHSSAMRWDVQAILSGYPEHVNSDAMWNVENEVVYIPWRLVVAKARKLILKGKLDGCFCGCRGDWSIVEVPSWDDFKKAVGEQMLKNRMRRMK